jgi:hypothetical protein
LDDGMGDFSGELKRQMAATGTGVRQLSRIAGYSAGHISGLRTGAKRPSPEAARDLDDALGAMGRLAACVPPAAPAAAAVRRAGDITAILAAVPEQGHAGPVGDDDYDKLIQALSDWASRMKRRDLLAVLSAAAAAACASPGRVPSDAPRRTLLAATDGHADESVAVHMTEILRHLMRQEDTAGPQVVVGTVLAQYEVARQLLASGPSPAVRTQLLSLAANIARFTGWLLFDLGDYKRATHWYEVARSAAHEADDDAMCSLVLANWSHLATWTGDPRLGVEHALGAVAWGQRAGSRLLVSYGCDVGARAYARIARRDRHSDYKTCMASLDQAQQEQACAPDGDPGAGLVYFYDPALHLSTRTECLLSLGDPEPALGLARQSLAETDPAFVRNMALTRTKAAGALLQMKRVDEACAELAGAATLTRGHTSARLAAVIASTRQALGPWTGTKAVAALDDHLADCAITA